VKSGDGDAPVLPPAEYLAWQHEARSKLEAAVEGGRLPHALLVHGPAGVGKDRFAAALAAALLCSGRGDRLEACGSCTNCALTRAGSHPDLRWLMPEDGRRSISVDQVREATEQLGMTSMRRGYRVAILSPAEAMTINAQNALLKTLEEPAASTLIVLLSSRPSRLRPTLRSRCQRIEIRRPDAAAAMSWLEQELGTRVSRRLLELAGGAPLRAAALAPHFEDLEGQMSSLLEGLLSGRAEITSAAADMLGEGLPARLDWLEQWAGQIIRRRIADENGLTVPGGPSLQRLVGEVNISAAFQWLDRLHEARRLLEGSAAPQLVAEALLVEARRTFGRRGVN
jgi:DNA polymerase-3 subunit delta'